jgi:hypothetical protein
VSSAIFVRDGETVIPQDAARGPWDPNALHGSAVAALLAGAFDQDGKTLTRVSVDLLAPVPCEPLTLRVSPPAGGSRATRQTVSLLSGERVVARAEALAVTQLDLDLPSSPASGGSPFALVDVPAMTQTRKAVAEGVGWECFDSLAVAAPRLKAELPLGGWGYWMRLLIPVVEGAKNTGVQLAVAAADYSSSSTAQYLNFEKWSYRNADLVVHLSRPPAGEWIGLISTSLAQPVGSGLGMGVIYDEDGRLGQAAQSLVVEPRRPRR